MTEFTQHEQQQIRDGSKTSHRVLCEPQPKSSGLINSGRSLMRLADSHMGRNSMTARCNKCGGFFGSRFEDTSDTMCRDCVEETNRSSQRCEIASLKAENERLRKLVPEAYAEGFSDASSYEDRQLFGDELGRQEWVDSIAKKELEQTE